MKDFKCESEVFNGPKCKTQCERCKPPPQVDSGREAIAPVFRKWQEKLSELEGMKARGDLTKDWGECSLINARNIVDDLTAALRPERSGGRE
jgi:hypothetical protein